MLKTNRHCSVQREASCVAAAITLIDLLPIHRCRFESGQKITWSNLTQKKLTKRSPSQKIRVGKCSLYPSQVFFMGLQPVRKLYENHFE